MTHPIVHQHCKSCESDYVGPYSETRTCDPCQLEGQTVIVDHYDTVPVLPDGFYYEAEWIGPDCAEFYVTKNNENKN